MEAVTLTAQGRILEGTAEEPKEILWCLGRCLQLEKDCTLRSVFAMASRYPVLLRTSPFLEDAAARCAASPIQGETTRDFTALEFAKTVELTGAPGEPVMNIFTTLRGVPVQAPGGTNRQETGEIRFHQLDELLALPLRLGRIRHVVYGDRTGILECDTTFTLFEILDGIAWEMSFQGGSQQCSLRR